MNMIVSLLLDAVLCGLLITGILYAMKLSKQLAGLRASRAEMERFVMDFSGTVSRAEAGIKGLKQAARDGGDDLEKLIDKAGLIRDELQFLVESADQIANRLSQTAISAARPESAASKTSQPDYDRLTNAAPLPSAGTKFAPSNTATNTPAPENTGRATPSKAEQDLAKALEKYK